MPTSISLRQLAEQLHAELHSGDPDLLIHGLSGIETASAGQLTFVSNPRYAPLARSTQASAVLVDPSFPEIPAPTLRISNPYLAFAHAVGIFYRAPAYPPGIDPTAVIAPTASVGPGAHIGPYVVVMDDVEIGPDAVLLAHVVVYPHVKIGRNLLAHAHSVIREHCLLGDDVVLQNGAVVGADGFGFAKDPHQSLGSRWYKIPQSGPAILEDRVEIQANACIDRASIGETRIQSGAKIDNLVQVGHGSNVGRDTLLCAQVGLAGSTRVGHSVTLAGQVGVAGHCTIGDGAVATAQSGIPADVPPGRVVSGYPAVENRQWLKSVILINRLPDLFRNSKKEQK